MEEKDRMKRPEGVWAFGRVDFQAEAKVIGNLPGDLIEVLSTAPFPRCPPPSLRAATDYGGFKVFKYREYLCVVRFAYLGKADSFGRAVPSAWIVAGPDKAFGWQERHFAGFREFLDTAEDWQSQAANNLTDSLQTCLAHASTMDRDRALLNAQPLTANAFAEILAHMVCGEKLVVVGNDPRARLEFFDKLFFLLPHDLLGSHEWSTYADYMGPEREDLVCLELSLAPEKKTFFGQLKKRIGLAKDQGPRIVDSVSGRIGGEEKASRHKAILTRVYQCFLSGQILESSPVRASLPVVLAIIAAQCGGPSLDPAKIEGEIPRAALVEVMEKLELENLLAH